ncbi:Alpha-glucosidase 2 [Cardamine amara subsp. amara]|uniref:Mannosyl-oligosaccharide glucosidase n=1 Tax=Cardamine amara subsp. amara TaxID=228776 RepID=A0ABD0ZBE3_CARAN
MSLSDQDGDMLDNENQPIIIRSPVITPFPSPRLMDLPMFQGGHKESLYWGTYRPQAYFGVRARDPHPLVAWLMWLVTREEKHVMRHFCEDKDGLRSFGWKEHNGIDFGRQELFEADHYKKTAGKPTEFPTEPSPSEKSDGKTTDIR